MVAGNVFVLPMRPGDGAVSCLLLGRLMTERSACAETNALVATTRKQNRSKRITTPPHYKIGEGMSVMQEGAGGQNSGLASTPFMLASWDVPILLRGAHFGGRPNPAPSR